MRICRASSVSVTSSSSHLAREVNYIMMVTSHENLPNFNDLLNVFGAIWSCADDKHTVEEVDRKAVGTAEFRSSYSSHPTVRGHDDQWGQIVLESAVQERETFNV